MSFITPTPPPYDAIAWKALPFPERARMVCAAWAVQGYGSPLGIYVAYALKIAAYVGVWWFFCSRSFEGSVATWWLEPLAFQKAIAWSMLFEVLGMGCGSGPLTGRYWPPLGGALHFARPGTTKLPIFPGMPILGGHRRTWLDAILYVALVAAALRALLAPSPGAADWAPLVVILPILGLSDRTIFLAARAEHYWVTLVCFVATQQWLGGAKAVQLALWFWAGISKLNHHFPPVVCVMTSNSPFTRWAWLRRRMYRSWPDDLRPSTLATWMAHAGTALELAVPIVFVLSVPDAPLVGIVLMLALHGFISSNVPMGVPLEWNVMVVYGGFALFWAHPEVGLLDVGMLALFLVPMLVVVPALGNLFPSRLSFLMAMRYYAGNWAYSIWLFRGTSYRKLDRLVKCAGWVDDQLALLYPKDLATGLIGKVMGFRLMHLHGRALGELLPKAVDRLEDHEWVDGEIVAGLALGWNFGEGHLHQEELLGALQAQCGFEAGELRCIFVESQPVGRSSLAWRIVDAHDGRIAAGEMAVAELMARQPWDTPEVRAVAARG